MKNRKNSLKHRRIAVVMSDAHHTLSLVEVETHVRRDNDGDFELDNPHRINRPEVEKKARQLLANAGRDPDKYDYVGALVADDAPTVRGRIMWAKDIEPTHVDV